MLSRTPPVSARETLLRAHWTSMDWDSRRIAIREESFKVALGGGKCAASITGILIPAILSDQHIASTAASVSGSESDI